MNVSRRQINAWALSGLASALLPSPSFGADPDKYQAIPMGDSRLGSYTQPWFMDSFLELADDLELAKSAGKRFAIMWDLDGCPYCRETHLVNFAIPAVQDFIEANFEIIQMDVRGARQLVNFDGEEMSEKKLAKLNQVRYTPTFQFFPDSLDELKGKTGKATEIGRIPGYMKPYYFLTYFQFIQEKAYTKTDFRTYLKSRIAALKAKGETLPNW